MYFKSLKNVYFYSANLMGLKGNKLVLENDGFDVGDDEVLDYFKNEPFMIISDGEIWNPALNDAPSKGFNSGTGIENQKTLTEKPLSQSNCDDLLNEISEFLNAESSTSLASTSTQNVADDSITTNGLENEEMILEFDVPNDFENNDHNDQPVYQSENQVSLTIQNDQRIVQAFNDKKSKEISEKIFQKFENFQIPYEKFSSDVLAILEEKKKLADKMNVVVHLLISELRNVSIFLPISVIRIVAQKLADKFPDSFRDTNDVGCDTTYGLSILITKMINHNNYLNRPSCNELFQNLPAIKRKKLKTIGETCINWMPQNMNDEEICQKWEPARMKLKTMASNKRFTNDEWLYVKKTMSETYDLQRVFLNKSPASQEIKNDWPFLLKKECLFIHFEKLMNCNQEKVKTNFEQKKTSLLKHGMLSKQAVIANFFKTASTPQLSELNDVLVFDYIFLFFKEDRKMIFDILKV